MTRADGILCNTGSAQSSPHFIVSAMLSNMGTIGPDSAQPDPAVPSPTQAHTSVCCMHGTTEHATESIMWVLQRLHQALHIPGASHIKASSTAHMHASHLTKTPCHENKSRAELDSHQSSGSICHQCNSMHVTSITKVPSPLGALGNRAAARGGLYDAVKYHNAVVSGHAIRVV